MNESDFYENLKKYALNSKNYMSWRQGHTKVFGSLFADAFSQNEEAQICLTAALINISQQKFDPAISTLNMLESICDNEFDETSVYYFKGLSYEMLGNEAMMAECYEKIIEVSVTPKFVLAFHPYYRSAKLAQRNSDCKQSVYYYQKALEFYDGAIPDSHVSAIASHIMYDIATVCLYMHEYSECEYFLNLSLRYDKSQNHQRDYVKAVLFAVQCKRNNCIELLATLPAFLREKCQPIAEAIFNGKEPHYCIVRQDRSLYEQFWVSFLQYEATIKNMINTGRAYDAECLISKKLTQTLGFMKHPLDCRIEKVAEKIVIYCKNYYTKTLIEEHSALFSIKPANLTDWEFASVNNFEFL